MQNTFGSADSTRHAARVLHGLSQALAEAGATADDVLVDHLAEVPADLAEALAPVLTLPDRTTGWSVVRGLLAEFGAPGPTPQHWKEGGGEATRALEIALVLVGVNLGRVFGWTGQQDGRIVHDIVPSQGYEQLQVGSSSTTALAWHTEDAFHPSRPELLMLACMRNDDRVGSQVSSIRQVELSPRELELLSAPDLVIVPDDSYPATWDSADESANASATVWQADDGPCLCYDPSYTKFLASNDELLAAYDRLGKELHEHGETIDIAPGDILLIDNDVAVHGRAPFQPRYDGADRWLKRVLVRLPRTRPTRPGTQGFDQAMVLPHFPRTETVTG